MYLINLDNGEIYSLLVTPVVDNLAFSKDGKYLGILRGSSPTNNVIRYWIIEVATSRIVEQGSSLLLEDWETDGASAYVNYRIDFNEPVNFGLENCR